MNKKKIKICVLTTIYPDSPTSEKHKFVHSLNKELVKLGINVRTITPHSKGCLRRESMDSVVIKRFKYLPEKYEIGFVNITELISTSKIGLTKGIMMFFGFFFSTLFECLKDKPDVIHGHWAFPGGYIAYLMSKIFKIKFIVTIHGLNLFQKFKFLQGMVVNGLNQSSLIIANSSHTKKELIKMGVNENKIIKIYPAPNFVEPIKNLEELEKFRNQFASSSDKIILFVGRLDKVKGVEYLIKSIPEITKDKVHLIIVGEGLIKDQLENLAKQLGLEKKISFVGRISDKKLSLLHGISDIFVCPSIVEPLGLVIPEAMESEIPVVATPVGGIPDIVKHEVNGLLVKEKDPSSIANAIDRIFSDKDLEKKIVMNAKETVKEFYPERTAKQHFDILQRLVNKKNS